MTFVSRKNRRGFKGHWCMDYTVMDVKDSETGEIICSNYVFKDSTIFKGIDLKFGDIVEMTITIIRTDKKIKLVYYRDIKKI